MASKKVTEKSLDPMTVTGKDLEKYFPKVITEKCTEDTYQTLYDEVISKAKQIQILGNESGIVWFNVNVSFKFNWNIGNKPVEVKKDKYSPIEIKTENDMTVSRVVKVANSYNPLTHSKTARYTAIAYLISRVIVGGDNPSNMLIRLVLKCLTDICGYPDSMTIAVKGREFTFTKTELQSHCQVIKDHYIGYFLACVKSDILRNKYHPLDSNKSKAIGKYEVSHEEDFTL